MMCAKCWDDAYSRMVAHGGSQTYHYYNLLRERADGHGPCSPNDSESENSAQVPGPSGR